MSFFSLVKSAPFHGYFQSWKWEKVPRGQIRWIWWLVPLKSLDLSIFSHQLVLKYSNIFGYWRTRPSRTGIVFKIFTAFWVFTTYKLFFARSRFANVTTNILFEHTTYTRYVIIIKTFSTIIRIHTSKTTSIDMALKLFSGSVPYLCNSGGKTSSWVFRHQPSRWISFDYNYSHLSSPIMIRLLIIFYLSQ